MNELDIREQDQLIQAYDQVDQFVMKNYINELASYEVVPVPDELRNLPVSEMIRLFKINKLVYDKNENTLDKLSSVYNALAGNKGSLVMVIRSDGNQTDFYVGTKSEPIPGVVASSQKTLAKAFAGNFPGSELSNLKNQQLEDLVDGIFSSEMDYSMNAISAVSGVASLRDEEKHRFVQGVEKLIDAMKGDKFTAIYIADPVSQGQLNEIRKGYENLYSQLTPFSSTDLNFSSNESQAVTDGITKGLSESINQSLTKTQSHTENNTTTTNKSVNYGRNILTSAMVRLFGGKSGTSDSTSTTTGTTRSDSDAETTGSSHTNSTQESHSSSHTEGRSRSLQIKFENKSVLSLLAKIDEQLERLKQCEDLGMWNCAAYFIADNVQTTKIAANNYKSLMRGTNSSVESASVNTWDSKNKRNLTEVTEYVKKLHHPLINLNKGNKRDMPYVSPGSLVSGFELAIQAGLPAKSVSGLPVMESAEFGRNIVTYDQPASQRTIRIGDIFHMGLTEDTAVAIDVESFSMHTFITGSTGSGKSNTVYQLLDQLSKQDIRFMVVEPAKGEYKHIFGGRKDVKVLGTNRRHSELLQINPFVFPDGIHVLEHIDKLIEIFNACWPMYAAMPAVLKEAIEQVYVDNGWDLDESVNYSGNELFPSFRDLQGVLPEIIRRSEYSQEVKSNYTGALVTRVRSLTNGINGRVFTVTETDNHILFDSNCIIDLSRIGSMETRALIMGILVMRLQEHRMAHGEGLNSRLKHVTVLEEAHNLLRRTSMEQSQESSNLQGKAVEMLSSAIAEMRTYGEGFIIADQSPNLLDLSVIRNTNTKFILRLPDEADRQLVGKASNLDEDQIIELAKLKVGVSAVYQNNWLQPVLCAIDKFEGAKPYLYDFQDSTEVKTDRVMLGKLTQLLLQARVTEEIRIDRDSNDTEALALWVSGQPKQDRTWRFVAENLKQWNESGDMELWKQEQFETLSKILFTLYDGNRILTTASHAQDLNQWNEWVAAKIRGKAELNRNSVFEMAVIQCLLREKSLDTEEMREFYFNWVERTQERGII